MGGGVHRRSQALNARRHHEDEDRGPSGEPPLSRVLVLNARRHHDDEDDELRNGAKHGAPVLNARRHHDDEDLLTRGHLQRVAFLVLNARRHHDDEDSIVRLACWRGELCSTPEGITTTRTTSATRFALSVFIEQSSFVRRICMLHEALRECGMAEGPR